MTTLRACRINAGYRTAREGAEAIAACLRTRPGRNGAPSVSYWRHLERVGQGALTESLAHRVARAFGCTINELRVTPAREEGQTQSTKGAATATPRQRPLFAGGERSPREGSGSKQRALTTTKGRRDVKSLSGPLERNA